jgi:hypothetical protein
MRRDRCRPSALGPCPRFKPIELVMQVLDVFRELLVGNVLGRPSQGHASRGCLRPHLINRSAEAEHNREYGRLLSPLA